MSDLSWYDIPNPYPLGVPERVRKEWDAFTDSVLVSEEPQAVLTIDCRGLTEDDKVGMEARLRAVLHECEPHVTEAIIHFMDKHRPAGTTHVVLGYSYAKGWCVRMERRP